MVGWSVCLGDLDSNKVEHFDVVVWSVSQTLTVTTMMWLGGLNVLEMLTVMKWEHYDVVGWSAVSETLTVLKV